MIDETSEWTVRITADTSELEKSLAGTARIGEQFARSMINAFQGIAFKGRDLGETIRALGLKLSELALRAAFKPLEQGIGQLFAGLFGGGFTGFANGGVLPQGTPQLFAKGGVVASPVAFPLGRGTGIAGERGPEAILPLARGTDGRLGVASSGGGSVVVNFNVTSPDAESFRRSEGQIAALLARAVSRGQRSL
jgi:phage-related minor tail protein